MSIRYFICLVIFVAANVSAQTDTPTTQHYAADSVAQDAAAIIALEQRDAAAAKVNDLETLVSLWTEDGVLLQPKSEPVVGTVAIRRLLEVQKQQTTGIVTLAYLEKWNERRILGKEAYEWGEMTVTARLPNGKEATQTVSAIRILCRQQDGSWKIARAIITPGPPNK